jgi:hypothetical protein
VFAVLFLSQRWRLARLRQRSREELKRQVEERTRDCAPPRKAWCNRPSWRRWGRCPPPWPTKSTSR